MSGVAQRLGAHWGRLGIRTRLLTVHFVLMCAVIGGVVWQSDHVISQRLYRQLSADLSADPGELLAAATTRPASESFATFAATYLQSRSHSGTLHAWIPVASGSRSATPVAYGASRLLVARPAFRRWAATPVTQPRFLTIRSHGDRYRIYAAPLRMGGRAEGTYVSASNLDTLRPDHNSQLTLVAVEGLAALLAAEAAAVLLLRGVLRTIGKVTEAADAARTGDLAQRLPYEGADDEVGRLVRTVDAMLEQLNASFSAQRRLLADVSHQLRTPLTIVRGHLELLGRALAEEVVDTSDATEAAVVMHDELSRLSLMVERVMLLGRAMEPDFLLEESIPLRELLPEIFDAAKVMANREWVLSPVPGVTLCCDPSKLRGALLNLLDNAVKATSEIDAIALDVELDGAALTIAVRDTGTGVPHEEQEHIFDRFRRSPSSRYPGSGLGLAIVRAVAESHGGSVHLSSEPGRGSTFTIRLPAQRVQSLSPAAETSGVGA